MFQIIKTKEEKQIVIATGITTSLICIFLLPTWSIYSFVAIFISLLHAYALLFKSFDELPIRLLFGLIMSLQMLFSPALVYNGLQDYQIYRMEISEESYFTYAIPAVLSFLGGLYLNRKKYGTGIDFEGVSVTIENYPYLPYQLIIIGFCSSFAATFVSAQLGFVFYLLVSFKFVGLFLLLLRKQKINVYLLILIYGSVFLSSLREGMFHDLIIWLVFLFVVLQIRFEFKLYQKILGFAGGIVLVLVIQMLKGDYRKIAWSGYKTETSAQALSSSFTSVAQARGGFFDKSNMAIQLSRFNQGWILASTMNTVPARVPYANGATLYKYLEAALLPRFLAPNKLNAGEQTIFNKYSGHTISGNTSMSLGSLADAYVNFGEIGGIIFLFLYGGLFNFVLLTLKKYAYRYPTLMIFAVVVFFFPVRAECDLATILGHLVKSCFLLWVMIRVAGKYFRIDRVRTELLYTATSVQ